MKSRRECQIYSKNDLLFAFETANTKIVDKFNQSSLNIERESIKHLQQITYEFLHQRQKAEITFPTFQISNQDQIVEIPASMRKRPIIEDEKNIENKEEQQLSFSQNNMVNFNQNANQYFCSSIKKNDQQNYEAISTQKLKKSFKKLGLDDNFYMENEDDSENENNQNKNRQNLASIQQKSLIQLLQESNKKLMEKINQKSLGNMDIQSDSSYPITQYSSNDSSNDHCYQQEIKDLSQNSSIYGNSQTYKPIKILHSPKKSKSQAKRVFIRNKKIPRWAQDLNKVNQVVENQKKNVNFNINEIYGQCIVEKLQTNIIFKESMNQIRGSSAKWNRNPYYQFIT